MAKYEGSIFGTLSGHQLDAVASSWKGIKYIRRYVKPQNPKTPAQELQRAKFANCSEMARRIVDTILNPFTIPAPKKMSAYNVFMGINTKLQTTAVMNYSEVIIVKGSLYNPGITNVLFSGPYELYCTFNTVLAGEAADDDQAVMLVFDEAKNYFWVAVAERSDGEVRITLERTPGGGVKFQVFLFFASKLYTRVGDSDHMEYTMLS